MEIVWHEVEAPLCLDDSRELELLEDIRDIFHEARLEGLLTTAGVFANLLNAFPGKSLCAMAPGFGVTKSALVKRRKWLFERLLGLGAVGRATVEAQSNMAASVRTAHRRRRRKKELDVSTGFEMQPQPIETSTTADKATLVNGGAL